MISFRGEQATAVPDELPSGWMDGCCDFRQELNSNRRFRKIPLRFQFEGLLLFLCKSDPIEACERTPAIVVPFGHDSVGLIRLRHSGRLQDAMLWPAPRRGERVIMTCGCEATIKFGIPIVHLYILHLDQKAPGCSWPSHSPGQLMLLGLEHMASRPPRHGGTC